MPQPRWRISDRTDTYFTNLLIVDGATLALEGQTPVLTISGGGGGTSDHALLSHLAWTASAHTGTASRFAVFGSGGAAAELAYPSTGLVGWTGSAWQAVTVSAPLGYSAGTLSLSYGSGLTVSGGSLVADTSVLATLSAVAAGYQPLDADLTALAALSSTGLVVRTGAGTVATRSLVGGVGVTVTYPDGASGDPTIDFEPEARNASYYSQRWTTDGATQNATIQTFANGNISYVALGAGNFPEVRSTTPAAINTLGFRSFTAVFALVQEFIHNFSIVTGPDKTNLRWRIGLVTTMGTALKPTGSAALVAFDPDSGQANATTNWYLLVYDGGGGAVSYTDTGVACNVDTAYQIELIPTAAAVQARVRVAGGTWGATVSSSTSLPLSTTVHYMCVFTTAVTAVARRIGFRAWSVYKEFA